MARFRETYITIDDFTGMQEVGIRYEGFVIGLGYAYVDSSTLMPLNMNGFLNRPNIPPKFNKFTLLIYQYVDASPEMVELSMRGIANNRAKTYTVQRGDTLTAIAQEHKVSVEDLVKWNKIANADIIFAGQTLIVSREAYDYLNIEKVNSVHSNMSTSYSVSANEHYRKNDAVYRADAYAREMQRREEWSKPVLPPSPNKEWEEHSKTRTNFLLGSQDNPSQFGEGQRGGSAPKPQMGTTGQNFSLPLMYIQFQAGGGKDLILNMASIDFSRTTQRALGLTGSKAGGIIYGVNLFNAGMLFPPALAFGRVNMIYHGNDQFSILSDKSARFDFDPLIDRGASWGRNAGNVLGAGINYNLYLPPMIRGFFTPLFPMIFGGPYDVIFIGTTYIPK